MSGFGSGPWGSGGFGQFPWSKQVLFRDLPEIDRRLDAEVGERRLERFIDALRPSFDELGRKAEEFGSLRDPHTVRTQFQGRITVRILEAEPSDTGRVIQARLDTDDPTDPFDPLGGTSIGWILKDGAGREFTVNAVHKLRDSGPTVELSGAAELPVSAFSEGDPLTGVLGFVAGSASVVGSGTLFLAEVAPGDWIAPVSGGVLSKVLAVGTNLTLTLETPYAGPTAMGQTAVVTQATRGEAVLRPPALIGLLGQDFGLDVDTHEAESFQRSSVRDIQQWLDLKGAQKSYDIIAKISGYRAVAFGLWRIDPVPPALPPDEVFEAPPGSGKFYTFRDPTMASFDEVAADVIPLDLFCFEELDWTSDAITPPSPSPPDGTSVEEAIAFDTQGLSVLATTDLGDGRWSVRVGTTPDVANIASIGYWYADFPTMPGVRHFLETQPVEGPVGEWTFEILAGLSPSFGATVNLNYQCHRVLRCDYCKASVIRVEVTPVEVLSEPETLLDGVLERLARKILQVVPAHVRITDIVHILGPVQAALNITVQASTAQTVTAAAMVGYYFDLFPADTIEVDPSHISASGSVSTTP